VSASWSVGNLVVGELVGELSVKLEIHQKTTENSVLITVYDLRLNTNPNPIPNRNLHHLPIRVPTLL